MSVLASAYMRLACYNLVGALFAPSDPEDVSLHTDGLFARICGIIRDHFADPDFGPCDVVIEAGISLRYLQKLFTARNSTYGHFIHSVRLDHAARLLRRRELLSTRQPLSETAYACVFADYTNFARKFRRQFGRTLGSCRFLHHNLHKGEMKNSDAILARHYVDFQRKKTTVECIANQRIPSHGRQSAMSSIGHV